MPKSWEKNSLYQCIKQISKHIFCVGLSKLLIYNNWFIIILIWLSTIGMHFSDFEWCFLPPSLFTNRNVLAAGTNLKNDYESNRWKTGLYCSTNKRYLFFLFTMVRIWNKSFHLLFYVFPLLFVCEGQVMSNSKLHKI